jgi:hypothetical protein
MTPSTVLARESPVGVVYGAALPVSPAAAAGGFLLGTVAFLSIGFLLAGIARRARAAQAIGMILFFPMWLLSGAGPPPGVMSEGMRSVSDVLPLTHVVGALQGPWLGWGTDAGSLLVLGAVVVWPRWAGASPAPFARERLGGLRAQAAYLHRVLVSARSSAAARSNPSW